MEHIAIDLGGKESQICVRDTHSNIVLEKRWPTRELSEFLKGRPRARVVLETCAESFAVADHALAAGHEVCVVPAMLVRSLGVGSRRIKTDRRDAQILSEVSCRIQLPSVHIRSAEGRALQSQCAMREGLVQARTQLINTVRGWLRQQLIRVRSGMTETFAERVQEAFAAAQRELPSFVATQLQAIAALSENVRAATQALEKWAKSNGIASRLMSVPGVGPQTAAQFVASIDNVERYKDAHALESFLGLTPSEHSSSERQSRGGITKAGPRRMRWLLMECAWCLMYRYPKDPMAQWAHGIAERRGKCIAVTALARKLAGVLYALWRDGTMYHPQKRERFDVATGEVACVA